MADSSNQPEALGPPMLSATEILRTPPTRIGKITESIVLPRTVSLVSLIATGVGLVLGAIVSLPFFGLLGLRGVLLITVLMGAIGLGVVTLSPIKGESFTKWLGLSVARLGKPKVEINGRSARVYIGVAPLLATAGGAVQVLSSATEVRLGDVDERGVLLSGEFVRQRTKTTALEKLGGAVVRSDWNPETQALSKSGLVLGKPRKEGSAPRKPSGAARTRVQQQGAPEAVPTRTAPQLSNQPAQAVKRNDTHSVPAQRPGTPAPAPAAPRVDVAVSLEEPKKLSKARKKR